MENDFEEEEVGNQGPSAPGRDEILATLAQAQSPLTQSPVNTERMSTARDRIGRILERSLAAQESPWGKFDDIATAGQHFLGSQGRASVGATMDALETNRLSKSAGILNTLDKVDSRQRGGMTPFQSESIKLREGELAIRKAEEDRAKGGRDGTAMMQMIDALSKDAADPQKARLIAARALIPLAGQENWKLRGVEAISEAFAKNGIKSKQPNEREGSFERELFGKMTPEQQAKFVERKAGGGEGLSVTLPDGTSVTAGSGKGGGGARAVNALSDGEKTAAMFVGQLDDMRDLVNKGGASIMGTSGFLSRWMGSAAAQAGAFVGQDPKLQSQLETPTNAAKSFPWIGKFISNEAEAAQFLSGVTALAYSYAKAVDPGGRITDQDVKHALNVLGSSGSPTQMMSAFEQLERDVNRRRNIERRSAWQPSWGEFKPFNARAWTGGEAGGGGGVAKPPAAPAGGAPKPAPGTRVIQNGITYEIQPDGSGVEVK